MAYTQPTKKYVAIVNFYNRGLWQFTAAATNILIYYFYIYRATLIYIYAHM